MQVNKTSTYDRRVQKIAEEYKQRGYRVTINPSSRQLPEFLQAYRPDILAEGPDDSVVIEWKTPDKVQRTDYWTELATTIQHHPGWHLELVVDSHSERELPVTIPPDEIKARLHEGLELAQNRLPDAALLITWSATEAALRLAGEKNRITLPDFRPATVISTLYTEGLIEREEYDTLMHCMRVRNSVAHGFRAEARDEACIEPLRAIALRLLQQRSAGRRKANTMTQQVGR